MTEILERKSKESLTTLDRELEEYSIKILEDQMGQEDASNYERLVSTRTRRLVKLPSARALRAHRWKKTAS
tara:strand:- start:236 stop:448 length:213 start_codon:yes stop_codon:yes gene_type:complete